MHYSSCEHPRLVKNSYTDEYVQVACRKCDACRNMDSLEMSTRLETEISKNKYSLFFTLTYDETNVPTAVLDSYDSDNLYFSIGNQPQCEEVVPRDGFNEETIDWLINRGRFGFVSRVDIQLFLKRLRRSINYHLFNNYGKVSEEERVRFYVVSEYGPKTFRPHYHGIIFTDSARVFEKLGLFINSSWKKGYTSCSVCNVARAHYVTKYVSCHSGMPSIYQRGIFRPFRSYSRRPPIGFGKVLSAPRFKALDASDLRFVVRRNGQNVSVPNWRGFDDKYFPKCRSFGKISHNERVRLYDLVNRKVWSSEQGKLVPYDPRKHHLFPLGSDGQPNADINAYRVSLRVNRLCEYYNVSLDEYVCFIESYYRLKDYENLKVFYKFQEELAQGSDYSSTYLLGLYSVFVGYLQRLIDVRQPFNFVDKQIQPIYRVLQSFGYPKCLLDGLFIFGSFADTIEEVLSICDFRYREEFLYYVSQSHDIMKSSSKTKYLYDYEDFQKNGNLLSYTPYVSCLKV